MALRRCLAGALAVSGMLAAGSYTVSSDLPHPSATSSPVPAIASRSPVRNVSRWAMAPQGTGAQLVAAGTALGTVLASELSGQHHRAEHPRVGPDYLAGHGRAVAHTHGADRNVPRRQAVTARPLARRIRPASGRSIGRSSAPHRRRHRR